MTITKITLIPAGSDDSSETETPEETPAQTEEIELWTGSQNLGTEWKTGISLNYTDADVFAKTTIGSILRFYYTDRLDGAQLQFPGAETIDVTDDADYVDIEVTTEILGEIAKSSNWPYVNGQNLTVTKITLIPAEN